MGFEKMIRTWINGHPLKIELAVAQFKIRLLTRKHGQYGAVDILCQQTINHNGVPVLRNTVVKDKIGLVYSVPTGRIVQKIAVPRKDWSFIEVVLKAFFEL